MWKFKHNCFFVLVLLLSFSWKYKAQTCVQFFPSGYYDCVTGVANTAYTVSGGSGPYTYTFINVASGFSVTGVLPTIPAGTITAMPLGFYNVFIASSNPAACSSFTGTYQYTPPPSVYSAVLSSASITCFGINNGSASVTPPQSFTSSPISYTWMPGNVNSPTINNMLPGVQYTVTIRDAKGCRIDTTILLTEPPQINSTLASTFITCFGQPLNTLITSTGNVGPTSYTVNGIPVIQNNAIGLLAGVQTIITRDNNNCIRTNTVLVTQGPQPFINFNKTSPNCPGGADGSITPAITAQAGWQYTWQPGGSNGPNLINIPAGSYTLILSYNNGACKTQSATVLAPAINPTLNAITSPENCSAADGAYTLNVSGVNAPFTFTTLPFGQQPSNTRSNLSSGIYTVLVGYNLNPNNNTFCVDTSVFNIGNLSTVSVSIQNLVPVLCNGSCNASVTLNVSNAIMPVTYSATGIQTTSINSFTNLCAGFYTIKAIDANGCPASTTINLTAPAPMTFTATAVTASVCAGQAVNLQAGANGGTGNHTFIWKPGNVQGQVINLIPNGNTIYTVNAYDANGCTTAPQHVSITVAPQLSINITSSSSGICPGTTAQITPTVTGGDGIYTYEWFPGNTTGPSIFVQNITVPVYTLIVKDACGSPTVTKLININLFPAVKPVFLAKSQKGCEPFCTKFINTTLKSKNATWNFGDGSEEKKGDTVSFCYLKSGKFHLTLSLLDSNFCRTSFSYTNAIQVLASPKSDFITTPQYITIGTADNVLFKNTTEDAIRYDWFIEGRYGGGTTDINYTFADTGCYKVTLTSENRNGCRHTLDKYICVNEDFEFYMPNCFTPNDNKVNDILMPKGTGWSPDNYSFEVYDRWGKRLFATTDLKSGWDGINSDTETPYNLYVWKIRITDIRGIVHKYAGSVTLLR